MVMLRFNIRVIVKHFRVRVMVMVMVRVMVRVRVMVSVGVGVAYKLRFRCRSSTTQRLNDSTDSTTQRTCDALISAMRDREDDRVPNEAEPVLPPD